MYHKYHKINPNGGGSYIYFPDWIKNKKGTIYPINRKDTKCFQDAVTVALNHGEIKKDTQRITQIKPFINEYFWEGINFPSEEDDWKKLKKNNLTIALKVLMLQKEKYILLMFENVTQIVKNRHH